MSIQVLDAPARPDNAYIRAMFDGMAQNYTLFARLIGFGLSQRLRREAVRGIRPGERVLDIGSGTGDLAFAALEQTGPTGEVTGLDFSGPMLEVARRRHTGLKRPHWGAFRTVELSADLLPHEQRPYDWAISAYVMRNLYERIDAVLAGLYLSLRPGGQVSLLDLTEPDGPVKKALYRAYLYAVVGLYGLLLFGKKYPVPYLPQSSERFLKPAEFTALLEKAGFRDVRVRRFVLGSVTLYQARRR